MHKYWPTLKSWINFTFSTIYAGGALANRSVQVSERASRMNKAALTNWSGENLPVCYRWCKKKKKKGGRWTSISVMRLLLLDLKISPYLSWAWLSIRSAPQVVCFGLLMSCFYFSGLKEENFTLWGDDGGQSFLGQKILKKKKIHQRHLIAI